MTQQGLQHHSLGRVEELAPLLREHQFRVFSESHLAQTWARTREAYVQMLRKPGAPTGVGRSRFTMPPAGSMAPVPVVCWKPPRP